MNLTQSLSQFVSLFILISSALVTAQGQELSSLGRCDLVLKENLKVFPNTVYSELGCVYYKTNEQRKGFGYGMFFSTHSVCVSLCQLKMHEKAFEKRDFIATTKIKLSGEYTEFDQDGYLVQELMVIEPEQIKSIICYSFSENYSSFMGLPENYRRVGGISRGYKINLNDFKLLVNKKLIIEIK
jgi:hypothetical protein